MRSIIYSAEKCVFGQGNIGINEMQAVLNGAALINEKAYSSLPLMKKILFRFFWHLY